MRLQFGLNEAKTGLIVTDTDADRTYSVKRLDYLVAFITTRPNYLQVTVDTRKTWHGPYGRTPHTRHERKHTVPKGKDA